MAARSHRLLFVVAIVSAFALLLMPALGVTAQADPVAAAWQRVRAAGSYHFGSDIVQITTPVATITNVGRTSREQRLRLEGETDLRQRSMELRLWTGGGSVLQGESGAAVRVQGDKTMVRDGLGVWKEAPGFTGTIAPEGDFMAYLQAVRDLEEHAPETRAGVRFTRYTFGLDGPTFAAYIRDQMEVAMRQQGALPVGNHLDIPEYYANMVGDGELWVSPNGLPLRQILRLSFPEREYEIVTADITVDFSQFGTPPAGLLGMLGLNDALTALRDDPTPAMSVMLWSLFVVMLLRFGRSRRLQRILPPVVVLTLLLSPLLSGHNTRVFFQAQSAQAAEQEQAQQESEMERTLKALQGEDQHDPHADPADEAQATVRDESTYNPAAFTAASSSATTKRTLATDTGVDTDNDGLTDYLEERIGTDPAEPDTDGDLITDTLEVNGFDYGGQMWYPDPLAMDSNHDSLSDTEEWFRDANDDDIPDDTDADGLPDLFDDDDDGDGVPDRMDTAPLMHTGMGGGSTAPFTEQNPFSLSLRHLSTTRPTFVDFQIRPQNPQQLWYANNILDWPEDRQGQMQDGDGATFADLASAAGREPTQEEAYGDMKLVPMLEIRITGTPTHLPPRAELNAYGVITTTVTTPFVGTVAYVPLSIVTDAQSGARVAFSARMPYRAASAAINAQQVRLVWVVQALLDACKESSDGQCTAYESLNQSQVVQTYYDAWTLTGLDIREDHGVQTAIIYEDPGSNRATPTPDTNPRDDGPLWMLANGLDNSFLAGRDCDVLNDDQTCSRDGVRDVRIGDIHTRFNWATNNALPDGDPRRWSIPDVLKVEQGNYPTLDTAVMTTAVTETKRILQTTFSTHWSATDARPVKPLLMFAREERLRSTTLDAVRTDSGYLTLNGSALTVDLAPPGKSALEVATLTGLKWQAFCGAAAGQSPVAWSACEQADYWEELEQRYASAALFEGETPEMAGGRITLAQLYYLSLAQGVTALVQRGLNLVDPDYVPNADKATDAQNKIVVNGSHGLIMTLLDITVAQRFVDTEGVLKNLGRILTELKDGLVTKIKAAVNDFKNWFGANRLRGTLVVASIVILVAGLITAAGFLIKYFMAGNKTAILTAKILLSIIVIGFTLAFSVIKPIMQFVKSVISVATGTSALEIRAALQVAGSQGLKVSLGNQVVGVIGAVLAIGITWAFFIYSMVSNDVTAFSPAFNRQLAEAVAASIYIIITSVLAASLVGLIIVGIIALVDAVLTAVCELGVDELRNTPGLDGSCFTFGTAATKVIAKVLYSYDTMIDLERQELVVTGGPDIALTNPQLGFRSGNSLSVTLPVTTTIVHKNPTPENAFHIAPYLWLFSQGSIRSSTFGYSLSRTEETINVDRGTMEDDWFNVQEHHKYAATPLYQGQAATTPAAVTGLPLATPGLNKEAPFYLNMGYAVPAYECWTIPNPVPVFVPPAIPVCYRRSLEGNTSTEVDALLFDVFPATLDGFMALADKGDGGLGLAWDPAFRSIKDADGDDMLGSTHNGLDPNDATWDADGDGLSDGFELDRRSAGVDISPNLWDTDNDGLTDAQEMEFGTHPARADSDNDGLLDGEEVAHLAYTLDTTTFPTETKRLRPVLDTEGRHVWNGGWTVVITGVQQLGTVEVRVSSDPTQFDTDGDGLSDQAEKELATGAVQFRLDDAGLPYHPQIPNQNPLKISVDVSDADRIVRPGQTFTYTTTLEAGAAPFAPNAVVDVTAPPVLGTDPIPQAVAIASGQASTVSSTVTVTTSATTQSVPMSSTVRTRLRSSTGPAWQWQPVTPEAALGGNGSYPFRTTESAASPADRQDSYMLSGLTTSGGGEETNGDIRAYEVPSGGATTLDQDGGDRLFKRGQSPSRVACNDDGKCMTVWDQIDNCNVVTLSSLHIREAGSDPGGGIEPRIYLNREGQEFYIYGPPNRDAEEGDYIDVNPDISYSYCGDASLRVYEADDTATSQYVGLVALSPGSTYSGSVYIYPKGSGHEIGLQVATRKRNRYHIAAALTGPDSGPGLDVQRSNFGLTRLPDDNDAYDRKDYRPVVATDGQNFMVAWERDFPGADPYTRIYTRLFNSNGDPISDEHLTDSIYYENPTMVATADIDLAWIGDRYRVIWRLRNSSSSIRMVDVRADGTDWINSPVEVANASYSPRLAYDPLTNRTLVVYREPSGAIKGLLYQGSDTSAATDLTFAASGSNPRVAYLPTSKGWLVGWNNTGASDSAATFNYLALRPTGTPLLTTSPERHLWEGAGQINGGTAFSCPTVTSTPVGDYRFEELPGTTRFVDQSGYGRHATIGRGQPIAGLAGSDLAPLSDYAVGFDGVDDSLRIPHSTPDDFSIAFWLRSNQAAGGETNWTDGMGLVDGYPGLGQGFGVSLGNGKVLFGVSQPGLANGYTIRTPEAVNNGAWHFVVATRHRTSGAMHLYLDGNPTPVASTTGGVHELAGIDFLRIGSLRNNTNFYTGAIDHLQIYSTALSGDTIRAMYERTLQSYCLAATPGTTGMPFARLSLVQPDRRGGRIDTSAGLQVQIDATRPTASIDSFANNSHMQGTPGGTRTIIIGGNAADNLSGIARVQVSVNSGTWQRATGAATWSYALQVTQGVYSIRVRATDGAGNTGSASTRTLIVDATTPTATVTAPAATVVPTRDHAGRWHVSLSGTVGDPVIGTQPGSGVAPQSVQVMLKTGQGAGEGNGWQTATHAQASPATTWTLDYILPAGLPDPTGSYTVGLRVDDRVGNRFNNQAIRIVRLDTAGPGAVLRTSDATRNVISSTLTLAGSISDTTSLDRLDARYTPITEVVALSGTVLLLPFDESAGAVYFADRSTRQQDAVCSVATLCPAAGQPGRFDRALTVASNKSVRVPHSADLDFGTGESLTVQSWIKTTATGRMLRKATTPNIGYSLQIQSDGRAALVMPGLTLTGGANLRDNQWHHVVAVVDRQRAEARLYVDGVRRARRAFTGAVANSANLVIGGIAGSLDQVAVWERALLNEEVAALYAAPASIWHTTTLPQRGAGVTSATWSTPVPAGLEGQYQIDLQAIDLLGNRRLNGNVWRGVIDTTAPRVTLTARPTGAQYTDNNGTIRYQRGYVCIAEDRHLSETSFVCSNNPGVQPSRTFSEDPALRALFPDLVQRTGLTAAYFLWEPASLPSATARACDFYGHCTNANAQAGVAGDQQALRLDATAADLPRAVVISPANQRVITSTGPLVVQLAAESLQPLKEVTLTLDGTRVQTISLTQAQGITRRVQTVTLAQAAEGEHTLLARATDWAGNTQATVFPVTFSLDSAPPVLTLDATSRDASDTYQVGSGMIRFNGTVTDTLGLAAVQLRVGDGAFADVEFTPNGTWRAAHWLGFAPEQQEYLITVRATDQAGQVTQVQHTVKIDITPAPSVGSAPPETSITAGPADRTIETVARFTFGGADDVTAPAGLRFECRLDNGVFSTCASPLQLGGIEIGAHTFEVRAVDAQGNADRSPASFTWTSVKGTRVLLPYMIR